jgi:hypothetical protein
MRSKSLFSVVLLTLLSACDSVTPGIVEREIVDPATAEMTVAASGPVTLRGSCPEKGSCKTDTVGATRATRVTCTMAVGANADNFPPACYFKCTPKCGAARLDKGKSGATSGPGTIELTCNGQGPLKCELLVESP